MYIYMYIRDATYCSMSLGPGSCWLMRLVQSCDIDILDMALLTREIY